MILNETDNAPFNGRFQAHPQKMVLFKKIDDSKEIPLIIRVFQVATTCLKKTPTDAQLTFLRNQIETLHSLREKHPERESELSQLLFNVLALAKQQERAFAKQTLEVPVFNGFSKIPPTNKDTAFKICQAIQQSSNPKEMHHMFQRLTTRLSESYAIFKEEDNDLSLANKIKETALFCLNTKKRPNVADRRWIHEVAQNLAVAQPAPELQNFATQFPEQQSRPKIHFQHLPVDAAEVYGGRSFCWANKFPVYDRE